MADTPKPPAFTIVGQRQDFGANQAGQYVEGMSVSFRTAAGDTGAVFVPSAEYQADKVRARIAAVVAEMEAVRGPGA